MKLKRQPGRPSKLSWVHAAVWKVDKSWKQTISAAKKNTQAISFCNSQKLLDRFTARPADLPWPAAIFIATSLLHAEDVALHDRAAAFLREHTGESHAAVLSDKVLPQLESHTRVLKRFGRYPHRNQALGRETTAAESAWLASDEVPGWARSQ